MERTQNAQTFTGQPLALQVEYGLFDKQHGQTLDLGFGRDWSSQPLAVIFLPAVGSSLPWHGQLWRNHPLQCLPICAPELVPHACALSLAQANAPSFTPNDLNLAFQMRPLSHH